VGYRVSALQCKTYDQQVDNTFFYIALTHQNELSNFQLIFK